MNDGPKWSQLTGISMLACHADAGQCHSVSIRYRSVWQDEISTGTLSSSALINSIWCTWTYKIVADDSRTRNVGTLGIPGWDVCTSADLNLLPVVSYRYTAKTGFEMHAVPKPPEGKIIKKLSGRREKTRDTPHPTPTPPNPRCSFCQALIPIVIL